MPSPRIVRLGTRDLEFPSAELAQIEDSSALLAKSDEDGGAALRKKLAADGFVYLRGALGREPVLAARAAVLAHLKAVGGVLAGGTEQAEIVPGCGLGCLPNMEGVNAVNHAPAVLAVIDGAPLRRAVGAVLGLPPSQLTTFDYKWLRAVGTGGFTGVHCDAVYMSRGSASLMTCWIPLEPAATLELGALAMLRGSHAAPGLARLRSTYGALDTEAEPGYEGSGWLTSDPCDAALAAPPGEVQWVTGDYVAGDVIIFGMATLHASTANCTSALRLSCDVRFQPAAEAADARYMGSAEEMATKAAQRKRGGAYAAAVDVGAASVPAAVTMLDLRTRWGLPSP